MSIFEDGTDIYWARSRVLEYLNSGTAKLPAGVKPRSGRTRPASAGSINTSCSARTARWPSCARCRTGTSASGWPRPQGVAEVASVGGFVRQYQVVVDPQKLRSFGVPLVARHRGDPRLQPRGRRPRGRDGRDRVHGARPRLLTRHGRSRADRAQGRRADAGAAARRGARRARPRRAARHHRARRRGRGGGRHRPPALRPERARRHRQRQGEARGHRRRPARGRADRDGLRPLRADPSRHRHAEIDADRGKPDRRGGVHRVPAACALRAGRRSSPCRSAC